MAQLGNLHRTFRLADTPAEDERLACDWWKKARKAWRGVDQVMQEHPPADTDADPTSAAKKKENIHAMMTNDFTSVLGGMDTSSFAKNGLNTQAALEGMRMIKQKMNRTLTSSGSVDTMDKMSRIICMTEAMNRIDRRTGPGPSSAAGSQLPADHVMRECLNFLRGFECFGEFKELVTRGETAVAYTALHASLMLNETAAMLDFSTKEEVVDHARMMVLSRDADPRRKGLFILGLLLNPVDALPYLFQLNRESAVPCARSLEILACMHGFMQKWDDLIRYAKEALAVSPPGSGVHYSCHYHIATAHYHQSQLEPALADYTKYLELCPPDSRKIVNARYAMAVCHLHLGHDVGEVKRCYEAGLEAERELEPFWGSYADNNDKLYIAMLDLSNADGVWRFVSGWGKKGKKGKKGR